MSTRNPMNERYLGDGVQGKTRKSAASAKPANKAASSVHEPAKKTAKEKKAEAKQRQREAEARYAAERRVASQMNAEVEEQTVSRSTQYQRLRRRYWIFLAIGLVLTIVGWYVGTLNDMMGWPWLIIVLAYGCIVYAFYIDLVKIRRLYKQKSEQA
ncbi:MAG: hypothetical protein IJH04_06140, partial [Eggerthellaceae bacterium]|nr:hypothetical protein [Eggerthellaceae bacterium]